MRADKGATRDKWAKGAHHSGPRFYGAGGWGKSIDMDGSLVPVQSICVRLCGM